MRTVITAIQVLPEVSIYNDEGKLAGRPKVEPFVVIEAEIPETVLEWLRTKLQGVT